MCDLDQRSRPKPLGREARVSHRIHLVLWGASGPSINVCTCSHPSLSFNGYPQALLNSSHMPRGGTLLFNGYHSRAPLKQALTHRRASVWKGNSGRGLDSGEPYPSSEVSLTSCWSLVIMYLLTLQILKISLLLHGNMKKWLLFKTQASSIKKIGSNYTKSTDKWLTIRVLLMSQALL